MAPIASLGSSGEAAALHRHGQSLYQQGRFDAAIDAFTEALKVRDVDTLGVLDNRAATYTKLAKYDLALRDARQMVKKEKQDERGYLRCAKTLLLDGKPEKALDIYAYGLKSLPKAHPKRQLIEQYHDKLRDKLTAKNYDPFSVLPFELASMVIQHFDFRQTVAILRVSKKWDQFLSSKRDLWLKMDLSGAKSKIHWTSVRSYINRSKGMLTHAVMKNVSNPSTDKVLLYLSRCPQLEHLELWASVKSNTIYDLFKASKRLKALIIPSDTIVPQEYITKFLQSLPLLERIEVHRAKSSPQSKVQWPPNLPNLRSIFFGSVESGQAPDNIPALFIPHQKNPLFSVSIPNLQDLRLVSNPDVFIPYPPTFDPLEFTHLRKLDLSGVYIGGNSFSLPSSLTSLRIRGGGATEPFPFSNPPNPTLTSSFPFLSTLILSDVPWATQETLHIFIAALKAPIKVLHVDSCFRLRGPELSSFLCEHASDLTELNVSHVYGINDLAMEPIAATLRDLSVVSMSYTDITGVSIKKFVERRVRGGAGPGWIYARGCDSVSSDAVLYGRGNGVEVFT